MTLIDKHFDFRKSFKANITKFLRLRYGTVLLKTLYMLPAWWGSNSCRGFHTPHQAEAYLKSTFTEVWDKEKDYLERTCSHKFRDKTDVNQHLMYYWQLMSGKFHPRRHSFTALYLAEQKHGEDHIRLNIDKLTDDIKHHKHCLICINDADNNSDETARDIFSEIAGKIREAYSEAYPEKSSFEL